MRLIGKRLDGEGGDEKVVMVVVMVVIIRQCSWSASE